MAQFRDDIKKSWRTSLKSVLLVILSLAVFLIVLWVIIVAVRFLVGL